MSTPAKQLHPLLGMLTCDRSSHMLDPNAPRYPTAVVAAAAAAAAALLVPGCCQAHQALPSLPIAVELQLFLKEIDTQRHLSAQVRHLPAAHVHGMPAAACCCPFRTPDIRHVIPR